MNRSSSGGGKRSSAGPKSHSGRRNARKPDAPLTLEKALERAMGLALTFEKPADRTLSEFFRSNRSLGRRDRSMIADRIFDTLRQRRLYAHLAESGAGSLPRRMALIADDAQASAVAGGGARLMKAEPAEQRWLEQLNRIDRSTLAPAVRYSLPDWLMSSLEAQTVPEGLDTLAALLLEPAQLDIRANLLKTDAASLREKLAEESVNVAPFEDETLAAPGFGLRVTGHPAFERLQAFADGLFEVQDAGSQWVVHKAGARRGQTVVDFCAGAGGKTLALAAMMRNSGQIYACDTSLPRLSRLKPRLARSGATNVQPMHIESEQDKKLRRIWGRADLVLVDAPCSGTGTLRRNPDLKWRQQPADLARMNKLQRSILDAAAKLLKPGGRLVYVTCSLLVSENESLALSFEEGDVFKSLGLSRLQLQIDTPDASADSKADLAQGGGTDGDSDERVTAPDPVSVVAGATEAGFVRLWPHLNGSDGFFLAGWQRALS